VNIVLSTDESGVSVRTGDLSPDDLINRQYSALPIAFPSWSTYTDLGSLLLGLSTVNKSNLLSTVESGLLSVGNTLNLDEGSVGVGVALATLVRKVASLIYAKSIISPIFPYSQPPPSKSHASPTLPEIC
jgi:hypothetical protein